MSAEIRPQNWVADLHQAVLDSNFYELKRILKQEEVKAELPQIRSYKWHKNAAPFHLAAYEGLSEAVKLFVDNGVNINSYAYHENGEKETVLHCAIRWRKIKLLKKSDNKEKYEQQRRDIQFKRMKQKDIVTYLLHIGVDTSLKGNFSPYEDCHCKRPLMGTPLDYAKQLRNSGLIKILALEPETLPWKHEGHLCRIL